LQNASSKLCGWRGDQAPEDGKGRHLSLHSPLTPETPSEQEGGPFRGQVQVLDLPNRRELLRINVTSKIGADGQEEGMHHCVPRSVSLAYLLEHKYPWSCPGMGRGFPWQCRLALAWEPPGLEGLPGAPAREKWTACGCIVSTWFPCCLGCFQKAIATLGSCHWATTPLPRPQLRATEPKLIPCRGLGGWRACLSLPDQGSGVMKNMRAKCRSWLLDQSTPSATMDLRDSNVPNSGDLDTGCRQPSVGSPRASQKPEA
jgi:hypothetical protein